MTLTLSTPSLLRPELEAVKSSVWLPPGGQYHEHWTNSHDLAAEFSARNEALRLPPETRQRTDEMLWVLGEHDSRTADHGRRVGGYMEVALHVLGDPEFSDDFHAGLLRIGGALHDVWKQFVPEDTMRRSWGDLGYGVFDKADFEKVKPHAKGAFDMLFQEDSIPPEAPWIGGCHHQFPDPMKPEIPAYGISLTEIDRVYAHDPGMRRWLHLAVQLAVAADVFDAATYRNNSYLEPGTDLHNYLQIRVLNLPLLAPKADEIITAMRQQQNIHYLRPRAVTSSLGRIAA